MNIILGYLFSYVYIFLILFITSLLSKKNCNKEISRKLVHIFVSLTWFIMIYYFEFTIHLVILPFTFFILNIISYNKNIFKGMERDVKDSYGTILYPLSMVIMSLVTYINNDFLISYGVSLFIMAFGDGLAAITGKYIKSNVIINNKTIIGALTVFVISIIILAMFNYNLVNAVVIALVATVLELIGKKGYDNIILPVGIFIVSFLLR